MILGIFARTFKRPSLEGVLDAVQAHGLRAVQFNTASAGLPSMPDEIEPGLLVRIRAALEARGLEMAAVSGTFNMIHPDPRRREEGLRRLGVLAAACRPMGTSTITLCTGTRDPDDKWRWHPGNALPDAWQDLRGAMERALAIADEHDLGTGLLGRVEDRGQRAGARHPGLVDHEHAARPEPAFAMVELEAESGDRHRLDPRALLELMRSRRRERAAGRRVAAALERVADRVETERLTRARTGDDHTHGVGGATHPGDQVPLLPRQRRSFLEHGPDDRRHHLR